MLKTAQYKASYIYILQIVYFFTKIHVIAQENINITWKTTLIFLIPRRFLGCFKTEVHDHSNVSVSFTQKLLKRSSKIS